MSRQNSAASDGWETMIMDLPVAAFAKGVDDRRFLLWNRSAEVLFGLPAAAVLGRTADDIFPALRAASIRLQDDRLLNGTGSGETLEEPIIGPTGDQRWLHTRSSTTRGPDGLPRIIVGISEDITERRRDAMRARLARAEAENLLSVLATMLVQVDDQDRILRYNNAAERIFGIPALAVLGKRLNESGLRLDWGDIYPLIIAALAQQTPQELHDLRCQRLDNREVYLDLCIVPAPGGSDGCRPSVLLLGHDITRRREQEAQRLQGQKLESIGHLAAGIAHEINTPIQFIGDNLRFLSSSFHDLGRCFDRLDPASGPTQTTEEASGELDLAYLRQEVPKAIEQSLEGVERVADIVRAMKSFSHPDQGRDAQPVDLNAAIRTTCTVARNEYKYVADLALDLDPSLPLVNGHAGELNQVFLNLLVNAAQAIAGAADRGRGRISIATRSNTDGVEVRLSDTGQGISPEHRVRIFTPFFTTKPVGKGTGQGLNLCHAIITKRHRGSISFESEVGRGTTFIIRLPAASGQFLAG